MSKSVSLLISVIFVVVVNLNCWQTFSSVRVAHVVCGSIMIHMGMSCGSINHNKFTPVHLNTTIVSFQIQLVLQTYFIHF